MRLNKTSLVFCLFVGVCVGGMLLAGASLQQPMVRTVWQFVVENRINPFSFRVVEPVVGASPSNLGNVRIFLEQEILAISAFSRERYIYNFKSWDRGLHYQTADCHVNSSFRADGVVDEISISGEPHIVIAWLDSILQHCLSFPGEARKIHEFFVSRDGSLEKGYWSGSFVCVSVDDGLTGNSYSVALHPASGQGSSNYCYKRF